MGFKFWVKPEEAAGHGCTHHARFMGIIPGFLDPAGGLWISRSDLLNPVEDFLCFIWVNMRLLRGEEPDFMWEVRHPIEAIQ